MNLRKIIALLIILIFILLVIFIIRMLLTNEDSKKLNIINTFNNNKEKFFTVQKYADSSMGNLYIDVRDSDFNKNNCSEEIIYLVDKLNYIGIYEDESANTIKFAVESSKLEQGIMYIKSNTEENISPSMGSCERIIDNWFYYSIFRTYVE